MFREEHRFSESKNRISLFHKNRTSERRFGVLKFSPGPGPDSGGKKRKNDLPLFSGIQWRIFDSFSYIRTQATFIQAEKAGGKSDVLSRRKRKNREFWNRNLPIGKIRFGSSERVSPKQRSRFYSESSWYTYDFSVGGTSNVLSKFRRKIRFSLFQRKDEEPWWPS